MHRTDASNLLASVLKSLVPNSFDCVCVFEWTLDWIIGQSIHMNYVNGCSDIILGSRIELESNSVAKRFGTISCIQLLIHFNSELWSCWSPAAAAAAATNTQCPENIYVDRFKIHCKFLNSHVIMNSWKFDVLNFPINNASFDNLCVYSIVHDLHILQMNAVKFPCKHEKCKRIAPNII